MKMFVITFSHDLCVIQNVNCYLIGIKIVEFMMSDLELVRLSGDLISGCIAGFGVVV